MIKRLIVYATNVHQGGGRALLDALLNKLDEKTEFVFFLDERMHARTNVVHNVKLNYVKPSVISRFKAEVDLAKSTNSQDIVLCFGNLPPLLKLHARTIVFVQNRYLIDDISLKGLPLKVRFRIAMERLWISKRVGNIDEFIVQTPTMKKLLENKFGKKIPIHTLPFINSVFGYSREICQSIEQKKDDFKFIYVASGEPHKNHQRLLEAWQLLAEEGIFPTLLLTLSTIRFPTLCIEINALCSSFDAKVINVGELSHEEILKLYQTADALIYPSKFESFGLPLIEARQAGLCVLASELDYVRDVLDPEQTFDPESPVSIARAVKRYMGKSEKPLVLIDATKFISTILQRS